MVPERLNETGDTFTERVRDYGVAWVFFLVCKAVDSLITSSFVHKYGILTEGNPVVRFFMDRLGIDGGLLAKSAIEVGLVIAISFSRRRLICISSMSFLYLLGTLHLLGAATHFQVVNQYLPW